MTVFKRSVGKGMAERNVIRITPTTAEELKAIHEQEVASDPSLALAKIEAEEIATLTAAGLRPVGDPTAEDFDPPDGPEAYAARILYQLDLVRIWRSFAEESGDPRLADRGCVEAVKLGAILRERDIMAAGWNPDAVAGRASREGAKEGGRRSGANTQRDIEIYVSFRKQRTLPHNEGVEDEELMARAGRVKGIKTRRHAIKAAERGKEAVERTALIQKKTAP